MAESLQSASTWSTFSGSYLSPTSLFLLLNLVIGTIAVISRFNSARHDHHGEPHHRPLVRAPSLIDRVKSIDFSRYKFSLHDLHHVEAVETTAYHYDAYYHDERPVGQLERAPSLLQRVKSIKLSSFYRSEPETHEPAHDDSQVPGSMEVEHDHHVTRSQSERGASKVKAEKEKMRKSASEKAMDEPAEDREAVEKRRPATTRLEKTVSFAGEDDGVDAKADDFINKFKQQLKLQRLDSLLRYRDMLKGK